MVDKINSFIERDGVVGDKKFLLDALNEIYEKFQKVSQLKLDLGGAGSLSAAGEAVKKVRTEMDEMAKMSVQLVQAMEKMKAAQGDESRALEKQKQLLQQQNKELKTSVELQLANSNSINEARARVKQLTIERNALNLATEDGVKRQKELNAEIDKNNAFIKENVDAYQKQKINIGNYEGSAKIIVNALSEVEKKIESLREKQSQLQNFSAANPIGFKLGGGGDNLNQVTAELKAAEKAAAALNNITAQPKFLNLAGKVGDARQEIRGFTTTLIELEQKGLGNSDFAQELKKHLADLTDQVADTRQEIKALSSDTRSFDLFADSINTAASIMQTAVGAAQLFGDETEDVQKSIQTLMAVQNVANGVREIANDLTTKGSAANKVYAWTQGLIAVATDASATATTRLAAATKLLGIGLLVGAIAYLVVKYQEYQKAVEQAGAKQKLLNEVMSEANKSAGAEVSHLKILYNAATDVNLSMQARLKAVQGLKDEYPSYFAGLSNEAILTGKAKDAYDDLYKSIIKSAQARAASAKLDELESQRLQVEDQRRKINTAVLNEKAAAKDTRFDQGLGQSITYSREQQVAAAEKRRIDALKEQDKLLGDIASKEKFLVDFVGTEALVDVTAKKPDKPKKDKAADKSAEDARKGQFELEKQRLEEEIKLRKEVAQNEALFLAQRIAARQAAFEKEVQLAALERDFVLNDKKANGAERLKAEEGYQNKVRELEKQTAADIIDTRNKLAAQEKKQREDDIAYADALSQNTLQKQIGFAQREFSNRITTLEQQAKAEENANLTAYETGKRSKEAYELEKQKIENRFHRQSLLAEIEFNQQLLQLVDLDPAARAEAEKKLTDLKKELYETDNKNRQEAADKAYEIEKQKNEKLKELGNELKELAFSIITAGIDREKNSIQESIDALEKKKAKDIEVANQTITNAQERADAVAIIEARANAQKEAFERRKRQLDEQRARYERVKNIADIIQSTAIAVISALGAKPWTPANIALAAIVGAIGAAQIAKVLATPIPKFFRGKDKNNTYEGPAIVGDGGKSEAILREDGSVEITPDVPTLTHVGRRDIILPDAKDLAEKQFRIAIDATGKLVQGYQPNHQQQNKDVEKAINRLGGRIEKAIANIPQTQIRTTSDIEVWMKKGGSWQEFKNNR